jgi:TetR/AcrR family transcriptional regulator, mexJK operon transcriptional repressor
MKKADLNTKPRRGRPVDASKRDLILDCASTFFMERGYHATNMDDVAKAAKISKLTLYNRFADKDALFRAVIERKCHEFLPPDLSMLSGITSPRLMIQEFAKSFLKLVMSEDAIRIYRMMMAEARTQPDMIKMFYDAGPKPVKAMVDEMMAGMIAKKQIKAPSPQHAREHLMALLNGSEIYMHRALNIGKKPTNAAIEAHAVKLAEMFWQGYG